MAATTVLAFPLTLYKGFVREHAYGLSNMTFAAWLGDELKGLAFAVTLGTVAMMVLYAILARAKRTWWIWGAVASVAIIGFAMAIAPVFEEILFFDHPSGKNRILMAMRWKAEHVGKTPLR